MALAFRDQGNILKPDRGVLSSQPRPDWENLHLVNCKNGMTIIAIGWTRGNKKGLATILPTKYWDRLRALPKFDYYDIAVCT